MPKATCLIIEFVFLRRQWLRLGTIHSLADWSDWSLPDAGVEVSALAQDWFWISRSIRFDSKK